MDSLYIAWRYVRYYRIKTIVLVCCITLITFLPFSLQVLLNESERQLLSRAVTTPLLLGAKGSALDLVMSTLYYADEAPEFITMEAVDRIIDSDLAAPIPMYVRFKARGHPVVGTTFDYFDFRGLNIDNGRAPAVLGECALGAKAAETLNLKVGDSLVTSPETLFDLAGVYPLKMKIVGIFGKNHTADDLAVFVDVKTAWVIQGLGHGHLDVTKTIDPTLVLDRTDSNVAATAKLYHYTEITNENINSFHFHGDTSGFPISAVIVAPYDDKSSAILRGRFLAKRESLQILKPEEVVDSLLENIFRIKNVLDAVIMVVSMATILAVILVFTLSLRLRQKEIQTIFKMGCSRLTVVKLVTAEILIVVIASAVVCGGLAAVVDFYSNDLVRLLVIG